MYYVNRKLISVFRLAFPVGICLATVYFRRPKTSINYSLFIDGLYRQLLFSRDSYY